MPWALWTWINALSSILMVRGSAAKGHPWVLLIMTLKTI